MGTQELGSKKNKVLIEVENHLQRRNRTKMLCFRQPKTKDDGVEGIRISRLPSQRYYNREPVGTSTKPPQSPRFDERGGVQKDFGMGKFRKSQKIMRKNKELKEHQLPPPPPTPPSSTDGPFSERAVDVPLTNNENAYQPPGPDKNEKRHQTSKSVQNTPKQVRRGKVNHSRFSRSR